MQTTGIGKAFSMRASGFDLACKCRKSYWMKSFSSSASKEGQAFHDVLVCRIKNTPEEIEPIRIKYGLTPDEFKWVKHWAFSIEISIPDGAQVFVEHRLTATLNNLGITGQPDLIIIKDHEAYIPDWKYGRIEVEPAKNNGQLFIYAMLVLINYPEAQDVTVQIVQPRLNETSSYTYARDFLDMMTRSVLPVLEEVKAAETRDDYCYGAWCANCFGAFDCPAFGGAIVRLAQHKDKDIVNPKDALVELIPIAKACQYMARKVEDVAKAFVDEFGPIDLSDELVYKMVDKDQDEVIPEIAIPYLKEVHLDEKTLNENLKLSKSTIYQMLQAKYKGNRKVRVKDIIEKMREKGAIKTTYKPQYKIVKKGEKEKL